VRWCKGVADSLKEVVAQIFGVRGGGRRGKGRMKEGQEIGRVGIGAGSGWGGGGGRGKGGA